MSALGIGEVAASAVVVGGVAASWIAVIGRRARHERALLQEHARANRARGAAVEAAEEDHGFAPEEIERAVTDVLALGQALWRTREVDALKDRPDARLLRAWALSHQAWMGSGLEIRGRPSVDLLRVVNREDEAEDRVVLRVRLLVRCKHPQPLGDDLLGKLAARRRVRLDERWTLGRSAKRWMLLSVDGDPLAGPVLTAPLIPTSSHDTERLREESLAELAGAETGAKDVELSELVSAEEPPSLALLDLSLVDGRFLPVLIAAAIAHLVEAWEEAASGSQAPLERLASSSAIETLLEPGAGKRLVVRDAVLRSWKPVQLELARHPPAIAVDLTVDAIRFVTTTGGRYVAGSVDQPRPMALTWTLELTDTAQKPWHLVESNSAADAIPGWS